MSDTMNFSPKDFDIPPSEIGANEETADFIRNQLVAITTDKKNILDSALVIGSILTKVKKENKGTFQQWIDKYLSEYNIGERMAFNYIRIASYEDLIKDVKGFKDAIGILTERIKKLDFRQKSENPSSYFKEYAGVKSKIYSMQIEVKRHLVNAKSETKKNELTKIIDELTEIEKSYVI